jgi:hypothetical protein
VAWRLLISPSGVEGSYLEGTRVDRVLGESFFDDVLLRYRETGERLYLAGTETLETGEAYRIEMDGPGGRHETRFLDAITFLEIRRLIWGKPWAPPAAVVTLAYGAADERPLPIRQVVETADGVTAYSFDRYDFTVELDPYAFDLETVRQRERARIEAEAATFRSHKGSHTQLSQTRCAPTVCGPAPGPMRGQSDTRLRLGLARRSSGRKRGPLGRGRDDTPAKGGPDQRRRICQPLLRPYNRGRPDPGVAGGYGPSDGANPDPSNV